MFNFIFTILSWIYTLIMGQKSDKPKYALISGGAGGIGTQLCISFAKRGYTVFAFAPPQHLFEVKALQKEYPKVIPYAFDITDVKQIQKSRDWIIEQTNGGYLDVLYNNAGISIASPAIEFDNDEMLKLFQVNCFGHFYMTKYMSDFVIKTKGSIVFTASIAACVPLSWVSLYNATKAAINAYALTLHTEMKPFGVRVHSVITGGVDTAICDANVKSAMVLNSHYDVEGIYTSMNSSAMMSRNTNISPQKYAEGVVRDIVSKRDRFNLFRGAYAYAMFWVSRWLPVWLIEYGVSRFFKALPVWRNIRTQVAQEDKKQK